MESQNGPEAQNRPLSPDEYAAFLRENGLKPENFARVGIPLCIGRAGVEPELVPVSAFSDQVCDVLEK